MSLPRSRPQGPCRDGFEVVVASRSRAVHRRVDRQIIGWIVPGQRLRVGFDVR